MEIKWKSQNGGSRNKKLQFAKEALKLGAFEIAIFFYPYPQSNWLT